MLLSALLLGLISSFHCMGMCGPIAMMLPLDRTNQARKITQLWLYHLGRITAYTTIGLLFGLLGRGLLMAGFQQHLSIIIGLIMIIVVVVPEKQLVRINGSGPILKLLSSVKTKLGKQFQKKTYTSLFTIGLLNGFLPCGMVYMALFGALAMQDPLLGMGYMVLYGLGTVPLLSLVVFVPDIFSARMRNKIQRIIPYAAVCIGILFILRGLGLGIPYVSPSDMNLFVKAMPNCGM
ncbi:sulfite exporter TauE/SafE family protein [Flavobacterium kingsejongi]|uniref:Urease accessory protein UreH-like transmembrane domain-containing protein n=1 Tax=Flavobacterium kingsejongi TaxID=1678728 RepID=A0A2S1LQR4_9FLAO|nr:sulfite exporter TauE/SafE family protein [Flavobacterium kingsejongi]AWG26110.1 hypothetical protein FK004_13175 [Flavobacterium kingsejongi]